MRRVGLRRDSFYSAAAGMPALAGCFFCTLGEGFDTTTSGRTCVPWATSDQHIFARRQAQDGTPCFPRLDHVTEEASRCGGGVSPHIWSRWQKRCQVGEAPPGEVNPHELVGPSWCQEQLGRVAEGGSEDTLHVPQRLGKLLRTRCYPCGKLSINSPTPYTSRSDSLRTSTMSCGSARLSCGRIYTRG